MGKFKFKVGDKVKILAEPVIVKKFYGVCGMSIYSGDIAEIISRHDSGGHGVFYRLENIPYNWHESLLEVAKGESKIVITTDGITTCAALYDGCKLIREAKAICGKKDVFDFETGAKVAFEKLTAKPVEPKEDGDSE